MAAIAPRINVSDLVDGDLATGLATPAHEEVAARLVFEAERGAATAAVRKRADLAHVHQAPPESILHYRDVRGHFFPLPFAFALAPTSRRPAGRSRASGGSSR